MYSLDFLAINEYLFPRAKGARGLAAIAGLPTSRAEKAPEINPDSPRAGVFLATEAIFNLSGLLVGVFVRNTFDGNGRANGVKVCLKLVFQRREPAGRYVGFTDEGAVSLELGLDELPQCLAVLSGVSAETTYVIPNSDKALLVRFQPHRADAPWYLEMRQGITLRRMLLSYADAARVRLLALAVLKIHYPDIEDDFLWASFVPATTARTAQPAVPVNDTPAACDDQGAGTEPPAIGALRVQGVDLWAPTHRPLGLGKRKALWAVGMRWGGGEAVVRAIQNVVSDEGAGFLITAGNKQDFTAWDEAAALHQQGNLKRQEVA